MNFQLKGVPAIVAVVVLGLCALGYRMFLHSSLSEDPKVRQQLELNLQSEIAGDIMADSKAISKAIESGDKVKAAELAEGTIKRRVEIQDLDMRGSGDDIVIKANYTVHGPGGAKQKIGYFKYSHSAITGWRYRRETTSLSWYLRLF